MANGNDEFEGREGKIPGQLGALIHAFLSELTSSEYQNRMDYAKFVQAICAMENVRWGVEAKILTLDQALTLMSSVPVVSLVNMDYLGVKDAQLTTEFRVSASRQEESKVGAHAESQTDVKVGGIAALFGASGGTSLTAGTTYSKNTRRQSDYSSTVKCVVNVDRLPPPETISHLCDETVEIVKASTDINKSIIDKQKATLSDNAESATVPTELPKEEGGGDGGDSPSGGSGGGDAPDATEGN